MAPVDCAGKSVVLVLFKGLVLFDTPWMLDSRSCTYLTVSKTMKNKDKETLKNNKRFSVTNTVELQ